MRRTAAVLVAVVLVLAAQAPAQAYLKFGVRVGGNVIDVRWNGPIRYFVTERGGPGVTADEFRDAINRAFATWRAVPSAAVDAQFLGLTVAPPGAQDGRTTLGFLDRPDLDRVLGAASFVLDAGTGAIIESDVFFNTRFDWSVAAGGQPGRIDLESIALHEIGHLLGLGHSAVGETEMIAGGRRVIATGAIMFPIALTAGAIADRQLQADDIAGISDLYPTAAFTRGTGTIGGRVTRNGQGVFGAHIVAFNLQTGTLIGNFALSPQGEFVIAGLSPGRHLLRVEPLDDADTDSFFAGVVDINFRPLFAPRIVTTSAGGGSEDIVIEVQPR